jgi:hypothetical protein
MIRPTRIPLYEGVGSVKKRLIQCAVAFVLLASAIPAAAQKPTWGVYSDQTAFNKALSEAKARPAQFMSQQAKALRREQIAEAIRKAETRQDLERAATRFGLVIYIYPSDSSSATPPSTSGEIGIASTPTDQSDVTIYTPTGTWDNLTMEYYISGRMAWRNNSTTISKLLGDCFSEPCNDGGSDSISLVVSSWPASAYVTGYSSVGYYKTGAQAWYANNASYEEPSTDGKRAITVSTQDVLTTGASTYNWWDVKTGVWIGNWGTTSGTVTTVYAHTWQSTGVTGADFSIYGEAGSNWKVGTGLVLHFSTTSNKWAAQGAQMPY